MAKYYGMCLTTYKDPAYSNGRRKCTGRRMLTKLPSDYMIAPKCPHCGGRKWYLDKQIVRRHARERCNCGGLHFTHRRHSRYCYHSATAEVDHGARYA